jgi:Ca2+-binding EF-hand superfamily protein
MLGRTLAVALAATFLVGTALLPEARAQTAQSDFATTDLNDDGAIDREEYHRRMADTMFFADDDGDGMLTLDELPRSTPGAEIDGHPVASNDI